MSAMLELKPELVKTYLKLITEACVQKDDNKGTLRKVIWDYLYDKYENQVDYRDFLLAIRKFRLEGKMHNNEGIYTMASQVVAEIRAKTPTPVFTSKFAQDYKKQNGLISFLSGGRSIKDVKDDQKISSKISNIGKQQKIKGRVFNMPRQTITEVQEKAKAKEEARKAEEKVKADQQENIKKEKADLKVRLGFQTPVNQIKRSPNKQKSNQKMSEIKQKDSKAVSKKQQHLAKPENTRMKLFQQKAQVSKLSKRIFKTKKQHMSHQVPLHSAKTKVIQAPQQVKKQGTPKRIPAKESPRASEKKLTPALRRKIEQALINKNLVMRKKQMRADKEQRKEKQKMNQQKTWKRVLRTLNFSKEAHDGESMNEYKKVYPRQVVVGEKKEHKKKEGKAQKRDKDGEKRPMKKQLGSRKQKMTKVEPVRKTKIIKKESPKKKELVQVRRQYKKSKNLKRVIPQKERLERILKKLVMDLQVYKMDKQRKAKLRAVKAIKQLFINRNTKSQMFVDSKLIYV